MKNLTRIIKNVEVIPLGGVGNDSINGLSTNLTGSCFNVTINYIKGFSKTFLLDFGFHQGSKNAVEFNHNISINPENIDAVLLTHAHVDHCGNIPSLFKLGYNGSVYHSTNETLLLSSIQWEDSAKVMLNEYEARLHTFKKDKSTVSEFGRLKKMRNVSKSSRNGDRVNKPSIDQVKKAEDKANAILRKYGVTNIDNAAPIPPSYFLEDVINARSNSKKLSKVIEELPGVSFEIYLNGHILGSASILMSYVDSSGNNKRVLFSGDLGNYDKPFSPHGNPVTNNHKKMPLSAVFCETTYGGTFREDNYYNNGLSNFISDVNSEIKKGKTIIIPAFALDRSPEVLYHLMSIERVDIFFDTTSGNLFLPIYELACKLYKNANLRFKKINEDNREEFFNHKGSKILVTSSGMCNGGPVIEYLLRNISDENTTFMFTGYVSPVTIGGKLASGKKTIFIRNEKREVLAKIMQYNFFSSHADEKSLLRWLEGWNTTSRTKLYLNHGDIEGSTQAFKHTIERKKKKAETTIKGKPIICRISKSYLI